MTRRALCAGALVIAVQVADNARAQGDAAALVLDPVVVTATRRAERSFDVPASVDVIDGSTIRDGQPAINLSESLVRVPGIFAANRNNYAQDLQISSRGFGARATFGVRGVRLYQDFIPATMPDGQGQTGSFSLLSTQRIEVLRGPFSTLYGNASGGVIAVFTEDPTPQAVTSFSASAGSYATSNLGSKVTGTAADVGYVLAASRFDTQGYRAHSAATRDVVNAKLAFEAGAATRVTVIGNSQHQPESQDPLGLTQAQWEADPRQADPLAEIFDTRKTVNQMQGGVAVEHSLGAATTVRLTGYAGHRQIGQYLAFAGAGPTASGGVVNLDRNYGGVGARIIFNTDLAGRPLTLTAGIDADQMREARQGFVNDNGRQGALRRDEDDTVRSGDLYAEAQWRALPALSLTVGIRSSRVRYATVDHYVVGPNPDDSGSRNYTNTSPIAAATWHATDNLNVYASYGRGFETPTFAELAYRPVGPGLNLALDPAIATSWEFGVKWLPTPRQRMNVALFAARTEQEIVVDTATGGRTTYRNAGQTHRRGLEAQWGGDLGAGISLHADYTYLMAEFAQDFVSGLPPAIVRAGSRLPGVPPQQAYAVAQWASGQWHGFGAALEVQHVGRVYANDRNTAFAPAYTIANARVGFAQTGSGVKASQYVRVNNFTDRNIVGSVIVGDTNGRYFEPAPGRNWMAGVSVEVAF